MRRFAVGVAYSGERFSGFALNHEAALPSVQAPLLHALDKLSPHANFQISSRTDAGVHAVRNVFSVDIASTSLTEDNIRQGINYHLPRFAKGFLAVTDVELVTPEFNARSNATGRTYLYRLLYPKQNNVGMAMASMGMAMVMHRNTAWILERPLDVEAMQACSPLLKGEQDFSSFQSAGCQSQSTSRNVTQFDIVGDAAAPHDPLYAGYSMVTFTVSANAFLLRQVRNMVAAVVQVGRRRLSLNQLADIVSARSRALVVEKHRMRPAPAQGLFLQAVHYDLLDGRRRIK